MSTDTISNSNRTSQTGESTIKPIELDSPTGQKMHHSLTDPIPEGPGNVAEPAHQQKIRRTPEFQSFQMNYAVAINELKSLFNRILNTTEPVFQDEMQNLIDRLYNESATTIGLFDLLHNVRSSAGDDPVYMHSLNVALIARFIGKWLKFSLSDQICLGVCGLMHDIGKLTVPPEILNKPGRLTEEERSIIRRHPIYGFNQLKRLDIDPRIKKAALAHHERCDGTGYPFKRSSNEVHPFAQIVAIADVYDATTTRRSYRTAICPFAVIDNFEREMSRYNTLYTMTFLKNIAQTYMDNRVILNNGRSADIAILNQNLYSKPVIRFADGSFLDLAQNPDIWIQSVL